MIDREHITAMQNERYEDYLANKRINVAPMLGTNVCLATVTLGLTEAPSPFSGEFESKSSEDINRPLGAAALNIVNHPTTVKQAIRAQEYALAA